MNATILSVQSKKILLLTFVTLAGFTDAALKIHETFSLPLKATLLINPSGTHSRNDYVHLVFGITF